MLIWINFLFPLGEEEKFWNGIQLEFRYDSLPKVKYSTILDEADQPWAGGLACRTILNFFFFFFITFLGDESFSDLCLFDGFESLKCDGTCLARPSRDENVNEHPLIIHLKGLTPVCALTCFDSHECDKLGLSNTLQPSHKHTNTSWEAIGSTWAVFTCSDNSEAFLTITLQEIHLHSTVLVPPVVTSFDSCLAFLRRGKNKKLLINKIWNLYSEGNGCFGDFLGYLLVMGRHIEWVIITYLLSTVFLWRTSFDIS